MVYRDVIKAISLVVEDRGFHHTTIGRNIKVMRPPYNGLYDIDIELLDIETVVVSLWIRNVWVKVLTVLLADPKCFDKIGEVLDGE
jgi:hypothetical protein